MRGVTPLKNRASKLNRHHPKKSINLGRHEFRKDIYN